MEKSRQTERQYFKQQISPLFQDLITKITLNRPEDIVQYALKYFKSKTKREFQQEDNPFLYEDINEDDFIEMRRAKLQKTLRKKRFGVSSQANTMFNTVRKPISLRKAGVKQERTQIMIKFYFSNSFLFKDFDEQQQNFLIDSMFQEKTQNNQIIITQGQYGDCMYFIQDGFFECSYQGDQKQEKKKNVQFLKNYQAGDVFGQICLLHRAKRQAIVTSKTEGVLYSLTREAYSHVHKMSIGKKRSSYIQKLMNVNIFSNLTSQDFQKLCDLLKQVRFQAGSYIIYEGDMGNKFYIVIQGMLVAKSNNQQTFYQYYKEGDYFGELALINNKPRQLSVQAVTKCRLVTLTSDVFLNVTNRDKATIEIKNKYKDTKPITNIRKKKNTNDM